MLFLVAIIELSHDCVERVHFKTIISLGSELAARTFLREKSVELSLDRGDFSLIGLVSEHVGGVNSGSYVHLHTGTFGGALGRGRLRLKSGFRDFHSGDRLLILLCSLNLDSSARTLGSAVGDLVGGHCKTIITGSFRGILSRRDRFHWLQRGDLLIFGRVDLAHVRLVLTIGRLINWLLLTLGGHRGPGVFSSINFDVGRVLVNGVLSRCNSLVLWKQVAHFLL